MNHPADQLIAAWLVDDLDAEGVRALEEQLRRDPAARARFARFCQSETVLPQALVSAPVRPGTTGLRRAVHGASRRMRPRRPAGRFGWVLPFTAAAALVAVVVVVGLVRSSPASGPMAGQLGPLELVMGGAGSGDAVLQDGKPLRVGMQVPRGALVEVRSQDAGFRWRDGTRLEVIAGTTFQVIDDVTALRLTAGGLEAHVTTRSDTPFRIATPHARTTVMGTRFTLAVRGGTDFLVVGEGRVRFTAASDGTSSEVLAGETASADRNGLVERDAQVLGIVVTGHDITRVLGKRLVGRAMLRLADLPGDGINLRVDCAPEVKAVRTGMRGAGTPRLEQVRDFFVFGNQDNRATTTWRPRAGTFIIDVQAFADVDGREQLGPATTFELTIVP